MARTWDAHLTLEEIDRLLSEDLGVTEAASVERGLDRIRRHLAKCGVCQSRMQSCELEAARVPGLEVDDRASRKPGCPADSDWRRLAAGLPTEENTEKLLDHSAGCDHCGPLLRESVEDLGDDLTPEELELVAGLKSAGADWQQELAARLRAAPEQPGVSVSGNAPRSGVRATWPRLGLWRVLAAAAVIVVAACLWLWTRPGASPAELLAEAYGQERTLELRIPGARYAPLRQERGSPGASRITRPPSLLKAEAALATEQRPNDADWLDAKGRADLLEWNYDAALRSFKKALETEPESTVFLVDMASAYFERAETAAQAIDYGTAIDLLGKALAQSPRNAVARFNRAIVYERMLMYRQAIEDWRQYLEIDPKSDWAAVARQHLAELEQEQKKHEGNAKQPSADPAAFLLLLRGSTESLESPGLGAVDSRIEDYLEVAATHWLPSAYLIASGQRSSGGVQSAQIALAELARIAVIRHGDRWFADMVASPSSAALAAGIERLGCAITDNIDGNASEAVSQARAAEQLLQEANNEPGALRSRLEQVYALHRSARGSSCSELAGPLARTLQGRGYRWLQIQLLVEQSICSSMVGQFGKAGRFIDSAIDESKAAGYPVLHLRSLGMKAALEAELGNGVASWTLNRAGLQLYWSGPYPPLRAYQFYAGLASPAEEQGQWQLARALAREAVLFIASTSHRSGEAMARYRLANLDNLAGASSDAEQEFQRASKLFASLPQSEATRTYQVSSEIALAALKVQRGEPNVPLARLNDLQAETAHISDYIIPLRLYRALGQIRFSLGQYDEAERAFRSVVSIAEAALRSLPSERDRLDWSRETAKAYRGLVEIKLRRREDASGAFDLWEWYRAAALRSPHGPSPEKLSNEPRRLPIDFSLLLTGPPLPAIRPAGEVLPRLPGQTVLSYAQFTDGLAIWVLDGRGIRANWVPIGAKRIERLARRFGELCSNPDSDLTLVRSAGRELYGWLIAPVEHDLAPNGTLVIEPDDAIAGIPIQALPDSLGRYLGFRYAIVYSSGLEYRQRLPSDSGFSSRQRALVIGSPSISQSLSATFPPMPDAIREAQMVAGRFESAVLLSGKHATVEAVERELPSASVFHFAGHAFSGALHAGLLLAENASQPSRDGAQAAVFSAINIAPGRLRRCRLAVLSACSSGGNALDGTADPASLVRGFLRAGVPHIVASRWGVDSSATAAFMDSLYSALFAGLTVPEAVQDAARRLMAHSSTSHPYYWAAFSSYGRT